MTTAQNQKSKNFSDEKAESSYRFVEVSHVVHHDYRDEKQGDGDDSVQLPGDDHDNMLSSRSTLDERISHCLSLITFNSAFFGDNKRPCKQGILLKQRKFVPASPECSHETLVQFDLLARRMNLILLLMNPFFEKEEYFKALQQQLVRNFNICTNEYFKTWERSNVTSRIVTPVSASRRKNDDTRGHFCYREFRNIRNIMCFEWQKLFWFPCHVKTCKALANVNLWLNRFVIIESLLETNFKTTWHESHSNFNKLRSQFPSSCNANLGMCLFGMIMNDEPSNKLHLKFVQTKDMWYRGQEKVNPFTTILNPFTSFMRSCASSLCSMVAALTKIKNSAYLSVLPRQARSFSMLSMECSDDGRAIFEKYVQVFVMTGSCRDLVNCFMDWVDEVRKNIAANGGIQHYDSEASDLFKNLFKCLENLLVIFKTTEMHVFLEIWWVLEKRQHFFDFVQETSNISFFKTYLTPSFLGTFYMVMFILLVVGIF